MIDATQGSEQVLKPALRQPLKRDPKRAPGSLVRPGLLLLGALLAGAPAAAQVAAGQMRITVTIADLSVTESWFDLRTGEACLRGRGPDMPLIVREVVPESAPAGAEVAVTSCRDVRVPVTPADDQELILLRIEPL